MVVPSAIAAPIEPEGPNCRSPPLKRQECESPEAAKMAGPKQPMKRDEYQGREGERRDL